MHNPYDISPVALLTCGVRKAEYRCALPELLINFSVPDIFIRLYLIAGISLMHRIIGMCKHCKQQNYNQHNILHNLNLPIFFKI